MANIGILGGTFDPIHLGHTEPAKFAADYLSLDKILFMPASIPYHKATPSVSAKQRGEMVTLACQEEQRFYCDLRELERSGNTYTIDTLTALKQSYAQQSLFFIIGVDSLLTFTQWHQYQEILSLCHLVVNSRPNHPLINLNNDTKKLIKKHQISDLSVLKDNSSGGIIFVPNDVPNRATAQEHINPSSHKNNIYLDISSTNIRTRLAAKKSCQHLVANNVLDYIHKNALYR